jgi:hypothetical protein
MTFNINETKTALAWAAGLAAVALCTWTPAGAVAMQPPPSEPGGEAVCPDPAVVTLFAGQTIDVGTVEVAIDSTALTVTYQTTGGWMMTEVHLDIAAEAAGLPQTRSGNPKVGRFAWADEMAMPVSTYTFRIAIDELGIDSLECGLDTLAIAAHASVQLIDSTGEAVQQETAWADGFGFPGKSWATYFEVPFDCCDPATLIAAGDFRTWTQFGWGGVASGMNGGTYRDQNFGTCFPAGLDLGVAPDRTLRLTASWAIEEFLPQTAPPAALTGPHEDPGTTEAGALAGELVALALNIGFDACDPGFGASATPLADLVVDDASSPCYGMTVQQVHDEANTVLGGLVGSLDASQAAECAARINENFLPGTNGWTYLRLP